MLLSDVEPTTTQEKIQDAYKQFHLLKADPDWYDTWIANLIQAQVQAKGTSTKSLWEQHRQTEKARTMAQLVQSALRSNTQHGKLQAVTRPTSEGNRQEFSSKYLLEKACLDEAGHQFLQANNTPLLQHPMIKWFGEIGTNRPTFKQVLSGKFNPDTDNMYVRNLLQQLKRPENVLELLQDLFRITLMAGEKHENPCHLLYWAFTLVTIWPGHSTQTLYYLTQQ